MTMTFLDVCAGIGGFSLGLERAGMKCVAQVEKNDFCIRVLEKHWPGVPKWRDIKGLNPCELPAVELICGGYPCQPFSLSGKRRGQEDDRHLWPFIFSIVTEKRPAWCLFENVAGHVSLGLDSVLSDLGSLGYSVQAVIIPACAVNAPHRRYRVWIIANSDGQGQIRVNDTDNFEQFEPYAFFKAFFTRSGWISDRYKLPESRICTRNDGLPEGLVRHLEAYGNSVVPDLVNVIGLAINAAHSGIPPEVEPCPF